MQPLRTLQCSGVKRGFIWLSIRHNHSRPRFPPSSLTIPPKLRTIHLMQSFWDPDLQQLPEPLTNPACSPALPVIALRLFYPLDSLKLLWNKSFALFLLFPMLEIKPPAQYEMYRSLVPIKEWMSLNFLLLYYFQRSSKYCQSLLNTEGLCYRGVLLSGVAAKRDLVQGINSNQLGGHSSTDSKNMRLFWSCSCPERLWIV